MNEIQAKKLKKISEEEKISQEEEKKKEEKSKDEKGKKGETEVEKDTGKEDTLKKEGTDEKNCEKVVCLGRHLCKLVANTKTNLEVKKSETKEVAPKVEKRVISLPWLASK